MLIENKMQWIRSETFAFSTGHIRPLPPNCRLSSTCRARVIHRPGMDLRPVIRPSVIFDSSGPISGRAFVRGSYLEAQEFNHSCIFSISRMTYVICVCLYIVVSNKYCVFVLSCIPYVASFSGLSFCRRLFGILYRL